MISIRDHLTITVSASPAYGRKNTGLTLDQAQDQVATIRAAAPQLCSTR